MYILRILISVLLVSLIIYFYKDSILAFDYKLIDFEMILFSTILMLVTISIASSRFFFSLKSVNIYYPAIECFKLGLSSNLMSQIMPGGGMGGDLFKFILFSKLKQKKLSVTQSILIDRGLPLVVALLIASLFFLIQNNFNILIIFSYLVIFVFIVSYFTKKFIGEAFSGSNCIISVFHSISILVVTSLIFYLLLNKFGASISYINCFFVYSFISLSKIIPSFGGWGVRESAALYAFNIFNIDPSIIIISSIFFGLVLVFTSLIMGIFYIDNIIKIMKK